MSAVSVQVGTAIELIIYVNFLSSHSQFIQKKKQGNKNYHNYHEQ